MRAGRGSFFPPIRSMAARLAIALVVGSVLSQLAGPYGRLLALSPELVLTKFMLRQPLTYAFLETSPMGIIFGALILFSIGGALEMTWGSRRLLSFALGVSVAAGVATVLMALVLPVLRGALFPGGMVMTTALWIAYGLSHGRGQTNFWGVPISGNVFAAIGVGFVLLQGIFATWLSVIPELVAVACVFLYIRAGSPRLWWLKFTSWRMHQRLKGRGKHLRVISKDRNMPSDSDRYLH
jgi:membrane associated rhomboid family serine protease